MKDREFKQIKEEILLCFRHQYTRRWREYDLFFQEDISLMRSDKSIQKAVLIYCNLLDDLNFLIDLIKQQEKQKGEGE